jgi:hypothetical protein
MNASTAVKHGRQIGNASLSLTSPNWLGGLVMPQQLHGIGRAPSVLVYLRVTCPVSSSFFDWRRLFWLCSAHAQHHTRHRRQECLDKALPTLVCLSLSRRYHKSRTGCCVVHSARRQDGETPRGMDWGLCAPCIAPPLSIISGIKGNLNGTL